MVMGFDKLLPRVQKGELIAHLSERELTNPEGAGFDLRAGEVHTLSSEGFLGVTERETPKTTLLASYSVDKTTTIILQPRTYYLVKTVEVITLDHDMVGFFHPRSTLFRSGIVLQTGVNPPGYSGAPTFGLYNASDRPFTLELGARIAHITIFRIDGKSSLYRGQWQGGRVSTDKKETQV